MIQVVANVSTKLGQTADSLKTRVRGLRRGKEPAPATGPPAPPTDATVAPAPPSGSPPTDSQKAA